MVRAPLRAYLALGSAPIYIAWKVGVYAQSLLPTRGAGWVRNRRDGSVEAEIEGTAEQVDALLAWMAQGPPGASVADARVTELHPTGATGFEVRPTG